MKYLFFILLNLLALIPCFAQKLTPSAFVSAGKSSALSNVKFCYTIGDLIVATNKNGCILTQGFLQNNKIFSSKIKKDSSSQVEVKLYPNPATDFVNILLLHKGEKNCSNLYIYDLHGRMIKSVCNQNSNETVERFELDVRNFIPGQYFVRIVTNQASKNVASFKFVKK